jgi:hypothetical protein
MPPVTTPAASTSTVPAAPSTPPAKPAVDEEVIGEIKAAIVVSAILSEISDIFVGLKTQGAKKTYSVEGPDGEICQFTVEKATIQFLPGSWEKISQDKKRSIQKMFIDRVKSVIGQ